VDGLRRGSENTISSGWIASIIAGGAATAAAAESAILPNVCSTQKALSTFELKLATQTGSTSLTAQSNFAPLTLRSDAQTLRG
jgi:hypothetical protein